ncbi:predicted protein [Postia placenta Mad-698-R]|nr:predicted protein [Postia placenta Mad-698-R]
MSSPAAVPDKETLKLLLPLRYDGKTVIECNWFLSQLRIYWLINTSLTTIELKVQVALSLLDGDARAWATPYFAQLVSVQIGVQGATTPFANEAAFAAALRARFGNLDGSLWQAAEKRATEVEQILDISRARRPELNNFFSARGRGRGGARGGAPSSHTASASINAAVGKGNFPGTCFGCGKQGYRRFECPNFWPCPALGLGSRIDRPMA